MKRLVTFGDSHTFGTGLNFKIGEKPWPDLLASKLDIPYTNQSLPGISNLAILTNILDFNFTQTDLVCIAWSYYQRDVIFLSNTESDAINPGPSNQNKLKNWLLTHNEYDMMMRSWIYIHHAATFLTNINVKFKFILTDDNPMFFNIKPSFSNNIRLSPIVIEQLGDQYPRGLDNQHIGYECHQKIAELLHKELI